MGKGDYDIFRIASLLCLIVCTSNFRNSLLSELKVVYYKEIRNIGDHISLPNRVKV